MLSVPPALCAAVLALTSLARVESESTTINLMEGSNWVLNCLVSNASVELASSSRLIWGKANRKELQTYLIGTAYKSVPQESRILNHVSKSNVAYTVLFNTTDTNFMMHLSNVSSDDDDTYSCFLADQQDRVVSNYTLNVKGPPRNVHISRDFTVAEEGDHIQLWCKASGKPAPQFKWFSQVGHEIPSTDGVANLTATKEMAGEITCMAYNEYGSINRTGQVLVHFPPHLSVKERWQVRLGMRLVLICDVTAVPQLAAGHWFKDGSILANTSSSSAHRVDEKTTRLLLVISSVRKSDMGTYQCWANSSRGSSSASTYVTDDPYDTTMDVDTIADTEVTLQLLSHAMDELQFVLELNATNSSVKDYRRFPVPGQWHRQKPPLETESEDKSAQRIRNHFRLTGLQPRSHYIAKLGVTRAQHLVTSDTGENPLTFIVNTTTDTKAVAEFVTLEASSKNAHHSVTKNVDHQGADKSGDIAYGLSEASSLASAVQAASWLGPVALFLSASMLEAPAG